MNKYESNDLKESNGIQVNYREKSWTCLLQSIEIMHV